MLFIEFYDKHSHLLVWLLTAFRSVFDFAVVISGPALKLVSTLKVAGANQWYEYGVIVGIIYYGYA